MSTKLGLISDVHAQPGPLTEALNLFEKEGVNLVICPGDIAGYFEELAATIQLLIDNNCETILGNHDQSFIEENPEEKDTPEYTFLDKLPASLEYTIEDKHIYVVHAHPPDSQHGGIKLLDVDGNIIPEQKEYWTRELEAFDHDVLIVGHTHQVFAEQLGEVLVVNPGSSAFNHSCMILTLPDMTVQTYALQGREILKSWNFSMLYGSDSPYPPAKN